MHNSIKMTKKPELLKESTCSFKTFWSPPLVGGFIGSKSQNHFDKHVSYNLSEFLNLNFNDKGKLQVRKNKNTLKVDINVNHGCNGNNFVYECSPTNEKFEINAMPVFVAEAYTGYCGNDSEDFIQDYVNAHDRKFNNSCKNHIDLSSSCGDINLTEDEISQDKSTEFQDTTTPPFFNKLRKTSECSLESADGENFIVFEDDGLVGEEGLYMKIDIDFINGEEGYSSDENDVVTLLNDAVDANDKWVENYNDVPKGKTRRKVTFNRDIKVNKIVAWDYAYRAARPGPWEQMARDRVRFQERIQQLSSIISPILEKGHRDKIYNRLYS